MDFRFKNIHRQKNQMWVDRLRGGKIREKGGDIYITKNKYILVSEKKHIIRMVGKER